MRIKKLMCLLTVSCLLFLFSCTDEVINTPRPRGYIKVEFPKKEYLEHSPNCAYSFEYPKRSILDDKLKRLKHPCWLNLHYPQYGATMHFTYNTIVRDSLFKYIEDARKLAMKHTVRADDIKERYYENKDHSVYGLAYEFEGNVASNFQFFLTDSNYHFVRGSLYFNMRPNPDSLGPVIEYVTKDMYHLIETLEWKDI